MRHTAGPTLRLPGAVRCQRLVASWARRGEEREGLRGRRCPPQPHPPPAQVLQADDDIALGDDANRRAALAFALLTLGPYFTEEDLYHEIAKISYGGDVRMLFGEDPQKTRKIVEVPLAPPLSGAAPPVPPPHRLSHTNPPPPPKGKY